MTRPIRFALVLLAVAHGSGLVPRAVAEGADDTLAPPFAWTASSPLIGPADRPDDPCVSIKDPTVVRSDGRWHVFATIRCESLVHMEHLSFTDWDHAGEAVRHRIKLADHYHCAPQVFYFRPQRRWYLIYQWAREGLGMGPAYSTLDDPSKPETLTPPVWLYPKKPLNLKGWIDFWVICDDTHAYLFFTSNDGRMWRARTGLADFPHGWDEPRLALQADVFEASHTYRLKGRTDYLTVIEAQGPGGRRYYKAYLADRLDGAWRPLADSWERPFAGERNVRFAEGVAPWTDSISHGELVRDGVDETLTVDLSNPRFVFQGCTLGERAGKPYGRFPWRIGVLTLRK